MTDRYGLIGYPLGHSFSRKYFTEKFTNEALDAVYDLYPLETIGELNELLNDYSIKGLNVTIPYKQQVIPFLDSLSPEASEIKAVNVIKVSYKSGERRLTGYNTDAPAFEYELSAFYKKPPSKALILGTGGASASVAYILRRLGWIYFFVSRNPQSGSNLLSYNDLTPDLISDCKLIINTTPLGMSPNIEALPPIPYELLTPEHYIYDLVYNPEITSFMHQARKKGAFTMNGLGMLYRQADLAWRIWQQ